MAKKKQEKLMMLLEKTILLALKIFLRQNKCFLGTLEKLDYIGTF